MYIYTLKLVVVLLSFMFCPVQPDSPQIVKCEKADHNVHVTIDPPSSWSTPSSYFRLEHGFQYVRRDDGKVHAILK